MCVEMRTQKRGTRMGRLALCGGHKPGRGRQLVVVVVPSPPSPHVRLSLRSSITATVFIAHFSRLSPPPRADETRSPCLFSLTQKLAPTLCLLRNNSTSESKFSWAHLECCRRATTMLRNDEVTSQRVGRWPFQSA